MSKMVEKMNLKNLTPDIDMTEKCLTVPDINRPALQLTGYFDHFDSERVQVIGYVEYTYLQTLPMEQKKKIYKQLLSYKIPCLVFTTEIFPDEELLKQANETDTPVFSTEQKTSPFQAELIRWLNVELAPCISIHGVIVDVKTLFGVQSVRETQTIDLVITLEDWNKEKEYDRLGLEEEYTEFLGNKVVCHSIPIRPGRNLAIIVESASVNHRQKQMGYNAAQELYRRVQESLTRK